VTTPGIQRRIDTVWRIVRDVGLAEDLRGLIHSGGGRSQASQAMRGLAHGHRQTSRDRPAGSNFEETLMTINKATKTKAKPGQQKRFVTRGKASDESTGIDADQSKDTWKRRTAIVSTLYFIGQGDGIDAFKIAEILLRDGQDIIHKATGWALRYASEHLDRKRRDHYLGMKQAVSGQA
jgi:hypothetical protein